MQAAACLCQRRVRNSRIDNGKPEIEVCETGPSGKTWSAKEHGKGVHQTRSHNAAAHALLLLRSRDGHAGHSEVRPGMRGLRNLLGSLTEHNVNEEEVA